MLNISSLSFNDDQTHRVSLRLPVAICLNGEQVQYFAYWVGLDAVSLHRFRFD